MPASGLLDVALDGVRPASTPSFTSTSMRW
jgi:hypothetical protein